MSGQGSAPTLRPRITAFGASAVKEEEAVYAEVFALAKALAEHGWDSTTGGHQGLMAAFAEGMREGGGCVRGVMLTRFPSPPENALSEEIRAYDFFDRMRTLIEDAQAWVVLPGGLGTLAEFAMCWDMLAIGVLEPRPLIVYGEMWQRMLPMMEQELLFSVGAPLSAIYPCTTRDEVLQVLTAISDS